MTSYRMVRRLGDVRRGLAGRQVPCAERRGRAAGKAVGGGGGVRGRGIRRAVEAIVERADTSAVRRAGVARIAVGSTL